MIPPKLKERIEELLPDTVNDYGTIMEDWSAHRSGATSIATELWEEIVMLRGALDKCNYHGMDCQKEFVKRGWDCGCPGHDAEPALTKSTEKWGD